MQRLMDKVENKYAFMMYVFVVCALLEAEAKKFFEFSLRCHLRCVFSECD